MVYELVAYFRSVGRELHQLFFLLPLSLSLSHTHTYTHTHSRTRLQDDDHPGYRIHGDERHVVVISYSRCMDVCKHCNCGLSISLGSLCHHQFCCRKANTLSQLRRPLHDSVWNNLHSRPPHLSCNFLLYSCFCLPRLRVSSCISISDL